jgi:hypothetical protein
MPETDSAQYPNIFRAILKKRWYDVSSRRVSNEAFKLRSTDTGLSVLKIVGCAREICLADLNPCFGEFIVQTDRVIDLGLEVVDDDPKAPDFSENHAEIIGIPINSTTLEEKKRAEDFASELAALSSLHYDRNDSYV